MSTLTDILKLSESNCDKTIKCQPAASHTPDLIQTECVADSGLACQNKKIIKKKTNKSKSKTFQPTGINSNVKSTKVLSHKTKKCQPAASHTPDLIQTECVADSWLARQNKKIIKKKTNKSENKTFQPTGINSNIESTKVLSHKIKKCQPAASHTPDLIQTECVADSWLARQNKKITKKKTYISNTEHSTFQPPGINSHIKTVKVLSQKTKKCQPVASDTPDLIQTECVADNGLARQNTKKSTECKKYEKLKMKTDGFRRMVNWTILAKRSDSRKLKSGRVHSTMKLLNPTVIICIAVLLSQFQPLLNTKGEVMVKNGNWNLGGDLCSYWPIELELVWDYGRLRRTHKMMNKPVKMINGNRAGELNIVEWNVGSRMWKNKTAGH